LIDLIIVKEKKNQQKPEEKKDGSEPHKKRKTEKVVKVPDTATTIKSILNG